MMFTVDLYGNRGLDSGMLDMQSCRFIPSMILRPSNVRFRTLNRTRMLIGYGISN